MKSALIEAEGSLSAALLRWWRDLLNALTEGEFQRMRKAEPGNILAMLGDDTWWQTWNANLMEVLTGGMLNAGEIGSKTASRQLGMSLDWGYMQPAVTAWASQHAAELVAGILPDVQAQIAAIVTRGMEQGRTAYQIRDEIAALADAENPVFPQWRATRIARTEIIRAHTQGAVEGYKQSGVVSGMRWLDGQSGACPECRALHNKVVPLGGRFYDDPTFGDGLVPRHPHCRCSIAPVTVSQVRR